MTTELENRCLNTFPEWLRTLAADASDISNLLSSETAPLPVRRYVAAALNDLLKSLDLIPDGIADLGFWDDAFVLRVAASLAIDEAPAVRAEAPSLTKLAAEKVLIQELLGKDYARLERYVRDLTRGAARGRTVDEIIDDEGTRNAFLNELAGWSQSYQTPSFSRDEKNIIKLQSFLSAKLPA